MIDLTLFSWWDSRGSREEGRAPGWGSSTPGTRSTPPSPPGPGWGTTENYAPLPPPPHTPRHYPRCTGCCCYNYAGGDFFPLPLFSLFLTECILLDPWQHIVITHWRDCTSVFCFTLIVSRYFHLAAGYLSCEMCWEPELADTLASTVYCGCTVTLWPRCAWLYTQNTRLGMKERS